MIDKTIRKFIRERAKYLCEYCHSPEEASAALFEIDHIIPQSLGGSDALENLALACQRCNGYRYNFTTGIDPETQEEIPLFDPRQQKCRVLILRRLSRMRFMQDLWKQRLGYKRARCSQSTEKLHENFQQNSRRINTLACSPQNRDLLGAIITLTHINS